MFPFKGITGKHEWSIGMFEAQARHKLLKAKRTTKRDAELSQLCDKLDDLVDLTGTLTRLMLQYVEKHLSDFGSDETQEYDKFKESIDFETFRLIKYAMIEHQQRTQSASQLIDILEKVSDHTKKAAIIRAALEIALNQDDYSLPKAIDTSMFHTPISMDADEFKAANDRYECVLKKVESYMEQSDDESDEKYARLAQMISTPARSRTEKTMLIVRAWECEERNRLFMHRCDPEFDGLMHHHDSEFDAFLQRVRGDIRKQIAVLEADETPALSDDVTMPEHTPDAEELHNRMMENRLQKLFSTDETDDGGVE